MQNTNTLTDLRTELKTATRVPHEKLETEIRFNASMTKRIDSDLHTGNELEIARSDYRDVYARYLTAAYGFEKAMEETAASDAAVELHTVIGCEAEAGPPSRLIELDLRDTNAGATPQELQMMPNLPALKTPSRLLGAEYVRRGSRMGGAVLARVVDHNLGFDGSNGARFLNLHGKELRPWFMEFCERMNASVPGKMNREDVVTGAKEVFEAIFEWQRSLDQAG